MTDYNNSGKETSGCIGLQTTVCENGVINVKRPESDHAHSVFIDGDGHVLRCSCKGHKFTGHCVHQDELDKRPLVTSSAAAAAADTQQVATDGGTPQVANTTTSDTQTNDKSDDKGTDCPECHAEGTVTHKPQPGSDTIPTFVCANCGYSTFTPTDAGTTATGTDDQQTDTTDDEPHPQTDYWGNPVEHYDDGPVGTGEQCECQSCGAERFEIALIAATAETSHHWEEFYECQHCGARGSFRVNETQNTREAQRSWIGRMAYPE